MLIHVAAVTGVREPRMVARPLTPPVEKPLGILKKYTPALISAVPKVITT